MRRPSSSTCSSDQCARLTPAVLELAADVDGRLRGVDRASELGQRRVDYRGVGGAGAVELGLEQPGAQRLGLDQVEVENEAGLVVIPVDTGIVQLVGGAHCGGPSIAAVVGVRRSRPRKNLIRPNYRP